MTSSTNSPLPKALPTLIHSLPHILRALNLAKISRSRAQLLIESHHFAFWQPQTLSLMLQNATLQSSWPHYDLAILTHQNLGYAHLAITSSLTLSIIHDTPHPPSLIRLAEKYNVDLYPS